jgi:hypothetical protein
MALFYRTILQSHGHERAIVGMWNLLTTWMLVADTNVHTTYSNNYRTQPDIFKFQSPDLPVPMSPPKIFELYLRTRPTTAKYHMHYWRHPTHTIKYPYIAHRHSSSLLLLPWITYHRNLCLPLRTNPWYWIPVQWTKLERLIVQVDRAGFARGTTGAKRTVGAPPPPT